MEIDVVMTGVYNLSEEIGVVMTVWLRVAKFL